MKEFQFKRANADRWASQNPILKRGEPGLEMENDDSGGSVPVLSVKYGALYNWYAATDEMGISSGGGWEVPEWTDFTELRNYIDPTGTNNSNIVGLKLKDTDNVFWDVVTGSPVNAYLFNARGCGNRDSAGTFSGIKEIYFLWTITPLFQYEFDSRVTHMTSYSDIFNVGTELGSSSHILATGDSIRLFRPATLTELSQDDGTPCANYTGNDGKIYRTVKIGTQVWLADNLCETKYADGSTIPNVTDNTAWAALTTGGMCYYDNDIANAYTDIAPVVPPPVKMKYGDGVHTWNELPYFANQTELIPSDNILHWDGSAYAAYLDKKSVDPGYGYFYTEGDPPTLFNIVYFDGWLKPSAVHVVGGYNSVHLTGVGDVYLTGINVSSRIRINNTMDGLHLFAAMLAGNYSAPVIIGSEFDVGNYNGEHIIVDDFLQLLTINMTHVIWPKIETKTIPVDLDSILILDSNDSDSTKKLPFSNFKVWLQNYADSIYGFFQRVGTTIKASRLSDDFQFGDDTNNVKISNSGEITLNGTATVFDDLQIPGFLASRIGANQPSSSTLVGGLVITTFSPTVMNEVFFTAQLPHSYKEGSDVSFHIHWEPMTSPATTKSIYLGFEYTWVNINGVDPVSTTTLNWTDDTGTVGFTNKISGPAAISGTGKTISSIFVCRFYRDPTNAADDYTGAMGLKSLDFHFEKDTMGSKTATAK